MESTAERQCPSYQRSSSYRGACPRDRIWSSFVSAGSLCLVPVHGYVCGWGGEGRGAVSSTLPLPLPVSLARTGATFSVD